MNKEQLQQDIEALREKLTSMEATLNKVDKAFPQVGDKYRYILSDGRIASDTYVGSTEDKERIAMGNFYQTKAEAEKSRDKQLAKVRVIRKLRELDGDLEVDFSDSRQEKYYVGWRSTTKSLFLYYCVHVQGAEKELYSTKKEAWEWVIDNMADDVELMLGVNDD
jgi:hypothetical protein